MVDPNDCPENFTKPPEKTFIEKKISMEILHTSYMDTPI